MSLQSAAERRQHPRKSVDVEVSVSRERAPGQSKVVQVRDISLKGMAIEASDLSLVVGERLHVCLGGEEGDCSPEHVIEATVVNLREGFAGLQFESVGIYVLKDIQRLLRDGRSF